MFNVSQAGTGARDFRRPRSSCMRLEFQVPDSGAVFQCVNKRRRPAIPVLVYDAGKSWYLICLRRPPIMKKRDDHEDLRSNFAKPK